MHSEQTGKGGKEAGWERSYARMEFQVKPIFSLILQEAMEYKVYCKALFALKQGSGSFVPLPHLDISHGPRNGKLV